MHFSKKIISAVAAVAMVLTSFSAFTVASATALPTVTVDYIEEGMIDSNTDAAVKFTVSNLAKQCDTMDFEIQIPKKFIKLYDSGAYEIDKDADITKYMFKAPRGSSFRNLKANSPTFQKQNGALYQYKISMAADTTDYIENGDTFEFDFVLDGNDWANAPIGSFAIQNVKFRYVGELDPFEGDDKITVVNNAEVKAAETGTPSIGGTDKNAVENFAGYAAADNLGVFTNPDLATDKAVAFKTTVTGTTATGVVVWKVTSGGVSKYHKMSIGNKLTGGGDAAIGLAVEGLDDSAATAGVAFLQ